MIRQGFVGLCWNIKGSGVLVSQPRIASDSSIYTHAVPDSLLSGRRCPERCLVRPLRPLSLRHRRSVFRAHTDYDEHRIVLLRAALNRRHRSPWCNGKRRLLRVGGRARPTHRCRCIARGTGGRVCHVIKRRAVIERPAPVGMAIGGMNCHHCRHLAVARDQIFAVAGVDLSVAPRASR
jgi:hypothetical protein